VAEVVQCQPSNTEKVKEEGGEGRRREEKGGEGRKGK
jgi:hypothetical protein